MSNDVLIQLYVESPDGERFECEVPCETELSKLAADFSEDRGWPTRDSWGRRQRAVIELVDPENPDRTKRLRGEQTVSNAGLRDGALLRIVPEMIAGCFPESVRVSLANGKEKPIQDVLVGDLLLSGVPGTDILTMAEVLQVFRGVSYGYLVLNETLRVTESHPVWASGKWITAGELKVGDLLQDQSGHNVELVSIKRQDRYAKVFNLYLSSAEHTFFAESVLVHNMERKPAPARVGDISEFAIEEVAYYPFGVLVNQLRSAVTREDYQLLEAVVERVRIELRNQRLYSMSLEERIERLEDKLSIERMEFRPTVPLVDFSRGLDRLRELMIGQDSELQREFHTLEARLLSWLTEEQAYGVTETTRQGRIQVIAGLNDLVIRIGFRSSFIDLCRC